MAISTALNPDIKLGGINSTGGGFNLKGVGAGLIASGVMSGLSDIATTFINAQRTKNTYKFNEAMSGLNKRTLRLSADVAIKDIRKKAQSILSSQRASYARAGIDIREGSPIAVAMESQKNAELDEIYANINTDYGLSIIDVNTGINKMETQSAIYDQYGGIGKTILNTGVKIYERL